MARGLDEVPDVLAAAGAARAEPVLVLPHPPDCQAVRGCVDAGASVLSDRVHRALLDSTLEDERSDDEGDGAEDDEKEE
jgi:hypothetical protein